MSAPERELPAAQAATAAATSALAGLHERLNAGDATVTGADLVAAEAEVRAAQMLEEGARQRDLARQAAEDAQARSDALEAAQAAHQASVATVAAALSSAREAVAALVDACSAHQAATAHHRHAVARVAGSDAQLRDRIRQTGTLPGVPVAPADPQDILRALAVEVLASRGLPTGELYAGAVAEALAPFSGS